MKMEDLIEKYRQNISSLENTISLYEEALQMEPNNDEYRRRIGYYKGQRLAFLRVLNDLREVNKMPEKN